MITLRRNVERKYSDPYLSSVTNADAQEISHLLSDIKIHFIKT